MTGYVLGKDADLDLDEIWEYIAADDVDAADRWTGKLFEAFEALGNFSEPTTFFKGTVLRKEIYERRRRQFRRFPTSNSNEDRKRSLLS